MTTLEQVLLNTLSKDEHVRKAAERYLNEACGHAGYTVALLKVSCEGNNPKEVRQAASVALKNGIKRNWTTPEEEEKRLQQQQQALTDNQGDLSGKYTIPRQDRDLVRANILQGLAMVRSDNESLRRILAECVGILAEYDFPERWPTFIPEIVAMLANVGDRDCVHNAMLALRRVIKRFEYKRRPRKSKLEAERRLRQAQNGGLVEEEKNKREPLNALVAATFPLLLNYGQKFVLMDDDHAGFLLRMIGKIFFSATRLELPPHLHNMQIAGEWFKLWESTINKALSPAQGEGDDIDDLSLRPWLKCKKCALEIAVRVFQECVKDPTFVSDDDAVTKAFTQFFMDGGVATAFLQSVTQLLETWARGNKQLPSIIIQLCLSYCSIALEPSKTYKMLRPHIQFLVDSVILKCLEFTEKDQQEWNDEPEAYACHDLTPLEDVFDTKATAAHLLLDACNIRSRDVLDGVVNLLIQELNKRSSAARQDACLFAVGALAEILAPYKALDADGEEIVRKVPKRVEKYKAHLESMISSLIVRELNAPEAHIRARACWVVGRYAHVEWKDPQVAARTFGGLLDRMGDSQLPVQSQAASSLKAVLVLDPEESLAARALREIAVNHLPVIVEKYLIIMSKVGADDVVQGLQALIDAFNKEIAPMAADICRALVQAYFHYAGAAEDDDDDDEGKKASAAYETVDAINSLMECAAHSADKSLIQRMEPVVMPLLRAVIDPDCEVADYLDPVVTTYSFLTYYSPLPLSAAVWEVVGRMRRCFDVFAFDNLQDFANPLEHLAFRDPVTFFEGTDAMVVPPGATFAQCVYGMCDTVMQDVTGEKGAGEQDVRVAASILAAILQAAPSEQHAMPFIEPACRAASYWLFAQNHTDLARSTRAILFEVVESCFYASPLRTRQIFADNLLLGLQKLREVLPSHSRLRKKKMALLGLSSLLAVLPNTDGPQGQQAFALTLAECAELMENIKQQRAFMNGEGGEDGEGEDEDEDGDEEEEEEDDEQDDEVDEDDDYEDEEEEQFKQYLKAQGDFGGAWGNLDDEDVDDEDEDPEDYPWPQDRVDEHQFFQQALRTCLQQNPALVTTAVASLDDSVRQILLSSVPEVLMSM